MFESSSRPENSCKISALVGALCGIMLREGDEPFGRLCFLAVAIRASAGIGYLFEVLRIGVRCLSYYEGM